jgi:hypothetical protein
MTKITLHFKLLKPLDEQLMDRIARAGAIYGLNRVQVTPSLDKVIVDYDASRLSLAEVEAAIAGAGIPAERVPVEN